MAGENGKHRRDSKSRGGSAPVSSPAECFHAEVPKGKHTNPEAMSLNAGRC